MENCLVYSNSRKRRWLKIMKESMIKIWVDDERERPEDYDWWLKTTISVIATIEDEFC